MIPTNTPDVLLRTFILFITLLVLTRILGKKQMSHLTFFNYFTGITIGSIAANMIRETEEPFWDDFIGLIFWCVLTLLVEYIGLKFSKLRQIIDGQPTIVIKRGVILKASLTSNRVNLDDLLMLLRKQNIFSIKEVEYAILEPNGNLSVMKKPQDQQITKSDMNITIPTPKYLPSEIISDGKIVKHNLKELNLSEDWLYSQLKIQNISNLADILYGELQSDGTLFLQKK
ncbi:YetF domain-containing protein [Clostridium beijerinckii]|uniref:Uncharacterized membrane protein YcaP (DUF421 family) n=2 Tax=Clostridium beijerinckii TaxID=1520 RepID=A0A9Q5CKZ5_CLOBE|nr:DUF421 domain-containing protein [Clostridium beijerinckii]AQS06366.1 hypothetical protein CLBIJ_38130 [Clostridium beijerinckii]MBA2885741.1 uncharacterized membrane protein YcaP (DUF421 family) [Clostridium beijerinckii]MBA2900558.1 uncharacterized membrane protein YcaP (DUF421 family) [Clostridium beijerinckii]MBA2910300.1 uncharacterized membrane protein YcaP (DUF421 family) [Clostridium beijerinckii]MBA9014017.1 uncharacterized membrane protein YcaP (DUF421 family) [Clostridium beijeri